MTAAVRSIAAKALTAQRAKEMVRMRMVVNYADAQTTKMIEITFGIVRGVRRVSR
jgi:hypothetical protein